MSSENFQLAKTVDSCMVVIKHETTTPTEAYNAATMVLKKVLIEHELTMGPKDLRMLAEVTSTRNGNSPEGVSEAVSTIEALLGSARPETLDFTMDVLVNAVALTLKKHRTKLSMKHSKMMAEVCADGTVFNPKECMDSLIEFYEQNPKATINADDYDKLAPFVNHSNERTVGTIIDHSNTTERYRINMPVMNDDLSNALMDLAERMGNGGYRVDKRAWDHLLIYSPQFQKLKKKLKRLKRILKLI